MKYGKAEEKKGTVPQASNPIWNQKFEFFEIEGKEDLKVKCYVEKTFGVESIGNARVNLEGLKEGSVRDVWVPLEKVNSGELQFQIEAIRIDDPEGSKVMYKTLNPRWNQTLEFPDDGISPLLLRVKDHNALLPTSSIGDCVVEYQRLPPNQTSDKWIPLQGVKKGEIHIQITRKVPEVHTKSSLDYTPSLPKAHQISSQMKQMMIKVQSLIEDENFEELTASVSELESIHDMQEEYIVQLETVQMLLLNKISELGQEMLNSSPSLSRRSSGN